MTGAPCGNGLCFSRMLARSVENGPRPALHDLPRLSGHVELCRQTHAEADPLRKGVAQGSASLIVAVGGPGGLVRQSSKLGRAAP